MISSLTKRLYQSQISLPPQNTVEQSISPSTLATLTSIMTSTPTTQSEAPQAKLQKTSQRTSVLYKSLRRVFKPIRQRLNKTLIEPRLTLPVAKLCAKSLPNEVRQHALLSKIVYEPTIHSLLWKDNALQEYEKNETLSDPRSLVAVNHTTKHAVIAYRGSCTPKDILPDLAIAVGVERFLPTIEKSIHEYARHLQPHLSLEKYPRSRFLSAEEKFTRVSELLPGYEISVTGHSLGGAQAEYVSSRFGVKGHSFNSGCSPSGAFLTKHSVGENCQEHVVIGDLLSNTKLVWTARNTLRCYRSKKSGKHRLDGFIFSDDDRQVENLQ